MTNELYKNNIIKLHEEMNTYNAKELCAQYMVELLADSIIQHESAQAV